MYDPQTVQMVLGVIILVIALCFILGLFYGLFLLARIRSQAVGINKRLDELLSRTAAAPAGRGDEPGVTL